MDETEQLMRVPAWVSCLELMEKGGIAYGQVFPAEFLEHHLRCKRDTIAFGLAVSEIRKALERKGFYLTGKGQNGAAFIILQASGNADVMEHYNKAATEALKRAVTLGSATKLDSLTESEKVRHESLVERTATKYALLSRTTAIKELLTKHAPKLLKV